MSVKIREILFVLEISQVITASHGMAESQGHPLVADFERVDTLEVFSPVDA
jgi:hypothetical protein